MKPFSIKIFCDTETPVSLFKKIIRKNEYAFLLESTEKNEKFGRYSIIGSNPVKILIFNGKKNPFTEIRREYEKIDYKANPRLPRFQAPLVGYFSYETVRHFEKIKMPEGKKEIPESIFYMPKNLIIFDHCEKSIIMITYNENELKNLEKKVQKAIKNKKLINHLAVSETSKNTEKIPKNRQKKFEAMIKKAKEKICAGEIFQIVLSQLFQQKSDLTSFDLYRKLRYFSPSPYMYYLQYPDFSIIGSSPETLVRTEGEKVIMRPIAGTRRRGKTTEEEKKFEEELKNDEKEQAEHAMLVDLGRNDMGKIAKPGSVKITELMKIEKFSHVMHLVSEIQGIKSENATLFDIFQAAFPAGTLTGAPKIRAMKIISELEKTPREIYGGAVGYFDLSGDMDFAIAIRTMLYKKGKMKMRAGAGIVFDSKEKNEFHECLNKARGPLSATLL